MSCCSKWKDAEKTFKMSKMCINKNLKSSLAKVVKSQISIYMYSHCFDQVSAEASAHFVCGHARPRGNNTHQHRRLLHQGTGQEDSPGEPLAAKARKHALTDVHMKHFTEQHFPSSVCGSHSLKQETFSPRWNLNGRKRGRGLRGLLPLRDL